MSPVSSIPAEELYKQELTLDPGVKGTCFPFFDQRGIIQYHLVLRENDPTMYVLNAKPYMIKTTRLTGIRVEPEQLSISGFSNTHYHQLKELWHYDPWWLLKEPDYRDHWAVPQLKATNCVDLIPKVRMLHYTPDLTRIRLSSHKDNNMEDWDHNLLPVKPEQLNISIPYT